MFLKEDIRGILNFTLWNTILKNKGGTSHQKEIEMNCIF